MGCFGIYTFLSRRGEEFWVGNKEMGARRGCALVGGGGY